MKIGNQRDHRVEAAVERSSLPPEDASSCSSLAAKKAFLALLLATPAIGQYVDRSGVLPSGKTVVVRPDGEVLARVTGSDRYEWVNVTRTANAVTRFFGSVDQTPKPWCIGGKGPMFVGRIGDAVHPEALVGIENAMRSGAMGPQKTPPSLLAGLTLRVDACPAPARNSGAMEHADDYLPVARLNGDWKAYEVNRGVPFLLDRDAKSSLISMAIRSNPEVKDALRHRSPEKMKTALAKVPMTQQARAINEPILLAFARKPEAPYLAILDGVGQGWIADSFKMSEADARDFCGLQLSSLFMAQPVRDAGKLFADGKPTAVGLAVILYAHRREASQPVTGSGLRGERALLQAGRDEDAKALRKFCDEWIHAGGE